MTQHDATASDGATGQRAPVRPGRLVGPATVPPWMRELVEACGELPTSVLTRIPTPPPGVARPAAVLILLGESATAGGQRGAPDLLLLRRSDGMTAHAGQVAFPGGAIDPDDGGPIDAALREASEEVGLDPGGVRPVAVLPELFIPPSGFVVTPVLAHWSRPSAITAVSPAETAAVARVPIAHLSDPANRFTVRHPSGWAGPAFAAPDMLVWGFTGGLIDGLLRLGGWALPWDQTDVRDLDQAYRDVGYAGPEVR